jgi:signal transduction histidine kinase
MISDKDKEIADLAHKINSPLTTINGYTALIEKIIKSDRTKEKEVQIFEWFESIKAEVIKISKYTARIQELANESNPSDADIPPK